MNTRVMGLVAAACVLGACNDTAAPLTEKEKASFGGSKPPADYVEQAQRAYRAQGGRVEPGAK